MKTKRMKVKTRISKIFLFNLIMGIVYIFLFPFYLMKGDYISSVFCLGALLVSSITTALMLYEKNIWVEVK